jgi:t-SNARE complex subunit (syntaxin)
LTCLTFKIRITETTSSQPYSREQEALELKKLAKLTDNVTKMVEDMQQETQKKQEKLDALKAAP